MKIIESRLAHLTQIFFVLLLLTVQVFCQPGPPAPPPIPSSAISFWPLASPPWKSFTGKAARDFTNVNVVPSWGYEGTALSVATNAPAFLQLDVFENGRTNIFLDQGSLELWVSPGWTSVADSGTGPGAWATLWDIGSYTRNASIGAWLLAIDPSGSNLVWVAQSGGSNQFLPTGIDFDAGDWHQIVATWSETNSCLYVDGELATNAGPIVYGPSAIECSNDGFCVGSLCATGTNAGTNQFQGQLQWLVSYAYPLSVDEVSDEFATVADYISSFGYNVPGGGSVLGGGHSYADDSGPPDIGDGGTNSGGTNYCDSGSGYSSLNYLITTNYLNYTNFWLSISNNSSNAFVSLVSTLPGLSYEILTNSNLASTNGWAVWQTLLASNSITPAPPLDLNSNTLFFDGVLLRYLSNNPYYPGPNTNGAPVIITQPVSQMVTAGSPATFAVDAIGAPPLSCQWKFDGTNIAGATDSSLTISSVGTTNIGWYVAVVSNSVGTTTSAMATLTTSSSPPFIVIQPTNQSVYESDPATFSVLAIGALPLTYQWTLNGTNIPAATANSYTITNVQATNAGSYVVIITNAFGTTNSTPATLNAFSFYLITQPISQQYFDGDTVTLAVETGGNTNLTYQWTFNETNIPLATNSSLVIYGADEAAGGNYAVLVSDGTNSLLTTTAQLTDEGGTGGSGFIMFLTGPRQNYTFRSGVTYVISPYFFGSNVTLYGKTVIEAGAVLRYDTDYSTNSSVLVIGDLVCKGEPYNPAILTCIDDNANGNTLAGYGFTEWPQTALEGSGPYMDLTYATHVNIKNLRVCFADQGITTPLATGRLDLWDCQFLECNEGVVNLVPGGIDSLHNVLFAQCTVGIGSSTNLISIEAEQVTADVGDFFLGSGSASRIALTNSLINGNSSLPNLITTHVTFNPDPTNFQSEGLGGYYLTGNSPLHGSGTTNITLRLQTELKGKTTYPPIEIPAFSQIKGSLTFSPQVSRYADEAPDSGYYYDALDYTVANVILTSANVIVLPGTTIAVENQYNPNIGDFGQWTTMGFDVMQGSSIYSHGTPNKPNVFTAEKQVQETPNSDLANFQQSLLGQEFDALWFDAICFVPDYQDNGSGSGSPVFDFRFCQFYMPPNDYHVWAGGDDEFQLYHSGGAWEASGTSSVNFTLKDCGVYGGRINFGTPDEYYAPVTQIYPPGAVSLLNNTFDDTALNLDPTFYEFGIDTNGLNVDFSFQAFNNVFQRSPVIHLEPIPASSGNWTFENNLFDKCGFLQNVEGTNANGPIDYGYNGDYLLVPSELSDLNYRFAFTSTNQLAPTTTGDGFVDGTGEITLSQAPPYQSGPFGRYYMPTNTALHHAGSTTADHLGLYHYTTATNQTAECNSVVDIGPHYLVGGRTNGVWVPLDTDGDGIPDYVEDANGNGVVDAGETDPATQYTVSGIWDPTNSAYDDIDLSGDGLAGRIKKALGLSAFATSNPLALTQVITGEEPDIATFELPLNYNLMTNIGLLHLTMNGSPVTLDKCVSATNGNCMLIWNTTYDPTYLHCLQGQLTLYGAGSDTSIFTGTGLLTPFLSSNVLQFFESGSMYDDNGAYLDAQLPSQNASYTIQLYDPSVTPPDLIKTITNTTSTGIIQEDWDLTYQDGVTPFTGDAVDAVFNVTLLDPASGTHTKHLVRAPSGLTEAGPNFDFTYMYMPLDSSMVEENSQDGDVWYAMLDVVDTLTMPDNDYPVYQSYFNHYYCFDCEGGAAPYPGYLASMSDVTNELFPDLTNGLTKQFYCSAHGGLGIMYGDTIASMGTYSNSVSFSSGGIANLLGNHFDPTGALVTHNPFRFVFLDGCTTAASTDWPKAFGVFSLDRFNEANRNKVGPQAYVGWLGIHSAWMTAPNDDEELAYTETLDEFYFDWMNGATVAECIADASANVYGRAPFPVEEYSNKITITGPGYTYTVTNFETSDVCVIGHSGLTINGLTSGQDGLYPGPAAAQ